jgi:hypothetical protein
MHRAQQWKDGPGPGPGPLIIRQECCPQFLTLSSLPLKLLKLLVIELMLFWIPLLSWSLYSMRLCHTTTFKQYSPVYGSTGMTRAAGTTAAATQQACVRV